MTTTTQTKHGRSRSTTARVATNGPDMAIDTQPATERVTQAAHDAIDSIKEPAAEAERKLRDLGSKAERQVREKKEYARTRTDELLSEAKDYAQRQPLAAAGIAFAAGILVSRIIRS